MKTAEAPKYVGSDYLGRYYTRDVVGRLLVEQMSNLAPTRLLDLGAGSGSLSGAAIKRWSGFEVITVDIDKQSSSHLRKLFAGSSSVKHEHIRADALSYELPELIRPKFGEIDAAVCNPPFIIPKWRKGFAHILEEVGFSGCFPVLSDIDAAVLFLAQNLRLMSSNSTLGIILPDTLISSVKYKAFRKHLLENYCVHKAVRLPRGSFTKTDALAHIVILSKSEPTRSFVPLQKLSLNTEKLSEELEVDVFQAIERLDFDFHCQRIVEPKSITLKLSEIAQVVKRGSLSSSDAKAVNYPVFHTSDMTPGTYGMWCDLSEFGKRVRNHEYPICASPGDILVARVGRNLEYKVIGVTDGYPVITDCVYLIRVAAQFQKVLLKQLASLRGREWLASRTYGVGARQLTKADLLEFPIVM